MADPAKHPHATDAEACFVARAVVKADTACLEEGCRFQATGQNQVTVYDSSSPTFLSPSQKPC